MEKFPVFWKERSVGELAVERESLYSWYTVRVCLPEEGLWSAWLIGSGGEFRLGVLEPNDCGAILRRRFSDRMVMPFGTLLRGELRPVAKARSFWEPVLEPKKCFHTQYLKESLCDHENVLARWGEEFLQVAVLYDKGNSFPLVELFCFSEFLKINHKEYLVFSFDREEQIISGESKHPSSFHSLEKN